MTQTPRDWQKEYEGAVESLIAAVDRADAAEIREQRLKKAVETIKELSKWEGISVYLDRCYVEACDVLRTLYPDTPPKEEMANDEFI